MKAIQETEIQKIMKVMPDNFQHVNERDIFNASKVYESWDEVFNSEEYAEVWSGFQGKESDARILRNYEFVTAFVVEIDPTKNYGRPFQLFTVHKHDGVNLLSERTVGSMLSNSPMREVSLFDDCFVLVDRYYRKGCKETWNVLKRTQSTVR